MNEMMQEFIKGKVAVKCTIEVLRFIEDYTDIVWINGGEKPTGVIPSGESVIYFNTEVNRLCITYVKNGIEAKEFLEAVTKKEPTLYQKVLELMDLEIGDKIEIVGSLYNPFKVMDDRIYDREGGYIASTFADIIYGNIKFTKLPKTKTIILEGDEVEISEESFNALKESLLKD